ncbi:hypothetical protein Q5H93_09585 [Hymenobacter sp. ASUV-10]|uniref:Signal peptidase n=1 Tax=Hymenobacter aranciens TaxID=3063996 RepID=A0ABT9B9P4_9BACT|nr:hypothetical protein [Hymenobacter sp. ASUV-10]MDO7874979.1 hypothetical protein [Hymenobacter sp. ASUV-10]
MKSFLLKTILPAMVIMLSATAISMAQPGGGGPVPGPGNGGGPGGGATDVPVDGGISLLLAGGVAYGVKHLRDRRRKA